MWKYIILLLALKIFHGFYQSNLRSEDKEDSLLNVPELIEKYGYPAETHELQTEDGYLITMHRIPSGKVPNKNAHKIPVLLMHGFVCSSADWVVNGPEKALAYILADEGYDIWMGNARGNYYSRKHISLDPDKDDQFWKFSWSEIGIYDMPKMVSHILETTGRQKIHYIGHSQGGVVFYVMASEMPEFNDKILLMQGLAPGSYMGNTKNPVSQYLALHIDTVEKLFELVGYKEMLARRELKRTIARNFCTDESLLQPVCAYLLSAFLNYESYRLNSTMLPVYISHFPAGAASKQLIHYFQEHVSHKFRKFDYGKEKNLKLYGTPEPPDYNLTKITAPTVIHYSDNDFLVDHLDIQRLYSELGNPKGLFKVLDTKFNHMDFIWGVDARALLYDLVLSQMKMYNTD